MGMAENFPDPDELLKQSLPIHSLLLCQLEMSLVGGDFLLFAEQNNFSSLSEKWTINDWKRAKQILNQEHKQEYDGEWEIFDWLLTVAGNDSLQLVLSPSGYAKLCPIDQMSRHSLEFDFSYAIAEILARPHMNPENVNDYGRETPEQQAANLWGMLDFEKRSARHKEEEFVEELRNKIMSLLEK